MGIQVIVIKGKRKRKIQVKETVGAYDRIITRSRMSSGGANGWPASTSNRGGETVFEYKSRVSRSGEGSRRIVDSSTGREADVTTVLDTIEQA